MAKLKKIYDDTLSPGSPVEVYPITSTQAVYNTENVTIDALITEGYRFGGLVEPSDSPTLSETNQRAFYFAAKDGIYPNFGNQTVENGRMSIFLWNGSTWGKQSLAVGSANIAGYKVLVSINDLPRESTNLGYLIEDTTLPEGVENQFLYVWVGEGGDTLDGLYQNVGQLRGASAYEIARDNGYEGTQEQWLNDPVNGIKGVGIASWELSQSTADSGISTITVTLNNGEVETFDVHNGKGIASIAVVDTESSADSATNTYRVTYSDGTTWDFHTKNGKGIASVAIVGSYSSLDGATNTYRVTYSDNSTPFEFSVKNGNQGSSGYTGAAEDLEVVNNLTSTDATAALSAAQGKVLRDLLNEGYLYKGVATTSTIPGTPDQNVFYIATEADTYNNFLDSNNDPLVVNDGEICIFKWDSAWSKEVTGIASAAQLDTERKKIFVGSFVGADTDLVEVGQTGLIADNRYRIYLANPDYARNNTTTGLVYPYLFGVAYFLNGNKVADLVAIKSEDSSVPIPKSFDFEMPPAGEYDEIRIFGRANNGVVVDYSIIDITAIVPCERGERGAKIPITPNSFNYSILLDGKFGTDTTYKHAAIPVREGEAYELIGAFDTMRYAFATSASFSAGANIPLVPGTRVMQLWQSNAPKQIVIPAGCSFLLFRVGNPFNPKCYKFVPAEYRDGTRPFFVGCDQTFVESRDYAIATLTPGKSYRIIIESNLPADFDTGNTIAFGLYKIVGGNTTRVWGVTASHGIPGTYDFTAEAGVDGYYIGGRAPLGTLVRADFVSLDAFEAGTGILSLNPDAEFFQKFVLAKKPNYNDTNETAPLVIAHISDVHGSFGRMGRFMTFVKHWQDKGYIDEILDTGDVVANTYSQGVAQRETIEGIENVITLVGNHDTRASEEEMESADYPVGQNQWQYHSNISLDPDKRRDTYLRYMVGPDANAPYISNWGVIQPANAAVNGYCYFYKDYAERGLRLVALDVMGYDATQHIWLQSVLADAISNDLQVAILAHFCGELMTGIPCNYTSLFPSGDNISTITLFNEYAPNIPIAVNAFQENGGVFVAYLIGHYHLDMVNVVKDYPKQLVLSVASGGITPTRDTTKVSGSRSNDDFQIVSINTYDKTIRLIKVGADRDYYSRKKGTACFGYDIISDGGTDKVRGLIGQD